ncbi:MAG: GNAT family N-acetyltransferase [Flavobacteriaceae bacterium]
MIKLIRTDNTNSDFHSLVKELDAYLKITDGDDHDFYNQYNGLEKIECVLVLYIDKEPIGCGAFKEFNSETVEIKRMYVKPTSRGTGAASKILKRLEILAKKEGYQRCILETGDRQVEAVRFYHKLGYVRIPNYGQYAEVTGSNCFEKILE